MLQLSFFITMIHFAKSGFINSHREVEDNCDCEELLIENRLLRELLLGGKKIVPEPLSESVPELESSILQDGRNIDTGPIVEQIISTPSSSWSETKFYSTYKTQEIAPVTSEIPVLFRNRLIVTTITELETVEKILTSTLTSSVLVEVEPTSSMTISPTSSISPSSSLTPSQSISLSHASEGGKTHSPSITPSDSFSPAEETTQIQLIEPVLNPLSSLSPLNKDNSDPSIELSSAVNEDDNEKKQDKNIDRDKLQDNDLQITNAEEAKNEKLTIKKRPLINKFRFGVSEFGFKPFKIWRF